MYDKEITPRLRPIVSVSSVFVYFKYQKINIKKLVAIAEHETKKKQKRKEGRKKERKKGRKKEREKERKKKNVSQKGNDIYPWTYRCHFIYQ